MPRLALLGVAALAADPSTYQEPEDAVYWAPEAGAAAPFEAPRVTDLTRESFDNLILDGKVFVVPDLGTDWPLSKWDCDFFQNDPEFKKAAMNHQYAKGGGGEAKIGDNWQTDKTSSGAINETAPQVAPFYWGIKDVQYEKRDGWKKSMLTRVAKAFRVPLFMPAEATKASFGRTPEFWFGVSNGGAKAHMDSHIQATLSLQIAGTKRWRLMPLRSRKAPFLGMMYQDGMPYENAEGWKPIFDIELKPGEGLFFPPGMIHETKNIADVCSSSVTFQFDVPMAARMYRRFFPRVRQTADIHESWVQIRRWARLGMQGDRKGEGAPYAKAKADKGLEPHFKKLDRNGDGLLTQLEVQKAVSSDAQNAVGWHDVDGNGQISLDEFKEGFAYWSGITYDAIEATPKQWKKYQHFGTIENLEDLPRKIAKDSLMASLKEETRLLTAAGKSEL